MDKAKIAKLCNEIEDEVTDIAFNSTHKHIYDCCESIREYLKAIATEITAPPKSNGDKIRAMTDEELADFFLESRPICRLCKKRDEICVGAYHECWQGIDDWLKQEVSEDAGTD